MKSFSITEKTLNDILGYLGKQPYEQVAGMINALFTEVKAQQQAAPEAPAPAVQEAAPAN